MTRSNPPSSQSIQTMFDNLARRYDLFNHLTSLGLAGFWRRETLKPIQGGMRVLDLGCGTGDLSLEAIKKVGAKGEVVGLDFSAGMLDFAGQRYRKLGLNGSHQMRFVLKKAEELPIDETPFDVVVSGFVLRNLYENIDKILDGVYASLKSGGKVSFLDITKPQNPFVRVLWKGYMNSLVVLYGKILFGKDYPALYLTQSAERFLDAPAFVAKLKEKGFREVQAKFFMCGMIALYQAVK